MRFMYSVPRVGVGVIVKRGGKVLLGKRRGSHGEGTWGFPGGHLELWEDVEDCARREVDEETGLKIRNIKLGPYTNDKFRKDGKHFITLFVIADYDSGEAEMKEPEKCDGWEWFRWKDLPSPLMDSIGNMISDGYTPFEE